MYPHERSLVTQLAGKPFALIGVNSDSDREKIREIVKEKNITWRSFWNGPKGTSGPISKKWNVSGWPTIYVLDGEGVIRYRNVRGPKMDEAVTKLLAELGHEVEISHDEDKDEDHDAKKAEVKKAEVKKADKKEDKDEKDGR